MGKDSDNEEIVMYITKRAHYNIKILELLKDYFEKNPDIRFNQLVENLNYGNDYFYEEPEETYKRYKKDLEEMTPKN